MNFIDRIAGPDDQNLARLAEGLDLEPAETRAVLDAIVPEMRHYLEARTISRGGLADVVTIIGNPAQTAFLDPRSNLASPEAIARGNWLLDQVWQTPYRSRAAADHASAQTGVDAAKVRAMLPRIANLTFAALARETEPDFADVFDRFTGFPSGANSRQEGGYGPGRSPLPLPDDTWGDNQRNRYDDVSDVLRRQGGPVRRNPLWSVVRQIIGSALDFRSNSVAGYILRLLIYRYGWRIISTIFARLFR